MSHQSFHAALFLLGFIYFMMCPASHTIHHEFMKSNGFTIINACEIKLVNQKETDDPPLNITDFITTLCQNGSGASFFPSRLNIKQTDPFASQTIAVLSSSRLLL